MMNTHLRRIHLPKDAAILGQAWRWIQQRPQFYPATGGKLDKAQYLERAARPTQADFGVWRDGELHSLITTEADAPGDFNFHITSKRKPDPRTVVEAVYTIGWHLFDKLEAERICTYVPSFHHGSKAVAEACGLSFARCLEDAEHTFHGKPLAWHIYEMNRAEFLRSHQHNGTRS